MIVVNVFILKGNKALSLDKQGLELMKTVTDIVLKRFNLSPRELPQKVETSVKTKEGQLILRLRLEGLIPRTREEMEILYQFEHFIKFDTVESLDNAVMMSNDGISLFALDALNLYHEYNFKKKFYG